MTKVAYEKLIQENIEWLGQFPDCLERRHIEFVLRDSIACYYPKSNVQKDKS